MYMNTKIYKQVRELAEQLMNAAQKQQDEEFDGLYQTLKSICEENEGGESNHPVQWETLADFTSDYEEALVIYEKALGLAKEINERQFISSIYFSMASLQGELAKTEQALELLAQAEDSAQGSSDKQLIADIKDLKAFLLED